MKMARSTNSRSATRGDTRRVFRLVGGRVTDKPVAASRPAPTRLSRTPAPSEEQIRLLAYRKWEAAGSPPGDGVVFWLEAERELSGR